mmetsp:Transcript_30060/g.70063  ORF Transcript_30060/g.70063 Transcript_30060/m.70063 type:complete len:206 (-) Transcript_30060:394-1011(-)
MPPGPRSRGQVSCQHDLQERLGRAMRRRWKHRHRPQLGLGGACPSPPPKRHRLVLSQQLAARVMLPEEECPLWPWPKQKQLQTLQLLELPQQEVRALADRGQWATSLRGLHHKDPRHRGCQHRGLARACIPSSVIAAVVAPSFHIPPGSSMVSPPCSPPARGPTSLPSRRSHPTFGGRHIRAPSSPRPTASRIAPTSWLDRPPLE